MRSLEDGFDILNSFFNKIGVELILFKKLLFVYTHEESYSNFSAVFPFSTERCETTYLREMSNDESNSISYNPSINLFMHLHWLSLIHLTFKFENSLNLLLSISHIWTHEIILRYEISTRNYLTIHRHDVVHRPIDWVSSSSE
jgi:hypothetical protein